MRNHILIMCLTLLILSGCCKNKSDCKSGNLTLKPFLERIETFDCNNGESDYTYIFSNSKQIDSLQPTCFFTAPVVFPLDESNMRYLLVGRFSAHYKDTLESTLYKDTCSKILTYDVRMIQRDTALWSNGGGIQHIFCSVQNIPPDYKVEVKYKYVQL